MKPHRLERALAALLLAAACGNVGESPDGASLTVPAVYHEAMSSGGHLRHVGSQQADGGRIDCRSCHDLDREGFGSPGARGCGQCHEERSGFHHGPSDGGTLPDGGTVSCLTCHPFAAAEAPTPATPWVCLRCHARPIGNVAEVKAHAAACFFCHLPHREPFTQPTECTVCHEIERPHGAKGKTVTQECVNCHERHTLALEASKHCVACHADPGAQKQHATLVTQGALFEGHPSCGSCHLPHRFGKKDLKACTTCHEHEAVLAKARGHERCVECHDPHAGPGSVAKKCEACHRDIKNSHPPPKGEPQRVCVQCHPMHEARLGLELATACADCHKEAEFAGVVHAMDRRTGASLTCRQCHPLHTLAKKADQTSCQACHRVIELATAKMKKAGHAKCGDCHQGLPHKPSLLNKTTWSKPKLCLSCHEHMTPAQESHDECDKCHETHSGATLKRCVDCHVVRELPGLHWVDQHRRCETCHAPHGSQPYVRRVACLSGCHEKELAHEPTSEKCHACHLFRLPKPGDLAVELKKKRR